MIFLHSSLKNHVQSAVNLIIFRCWSRLHGLNKHAKNARDVKIFQKALILAFRGNRAKPTKHILI